MTYPINPNIPAASNDPADDQPLMQQNFANINSYLQIDHTNPSNTGAGFHEQVTFYTNNVPGGTVTPPVLFTNIQDGAGNALPASLAQLFFYSGTAVQGQNNDVCQANGSILLMGGIILKWGGAGLTGAPNSFPVAFPHNAFVLLAIGTNPSYLGGFITTALSASTYTVTRTSGIGATGYYYIAIGN